jgi:hypothetical protein
MLSGMDNSFPVASKPFLDRLSFLDGVDDALDMRMKSAALSAALGALAARNRNESRALLECVRRYVWLVVGLMGEVPPTTYSDVIGVNGGKEIAIEYVCLARMWLKNAHQYCNSEAAKKSSLDVATCLHGAIASIHEAYFYESLLRCGKPRSPGFEYGEILAHEIDRVIPVRERLITL